MNIALQFRPVQIRLYVAYMADAAYQFAKCEPGNTVTRIFDGWDNGSGHPYAHMWTRIDAWYNVRKLYELSDAEIIEMFNGYRATGYQCGDRTVTGMDIMNAKRRWDDNGWTRYERKRNGRRTVARMAIVPALACFGIALPME